MNKLKMLAVGLAAIFAIGVAAPVMAADKCPVGSLHANTKVGDQIPGTEQVLTSLGECNVPVDGKNSSLMEIIQTIINVILATVGLVSVIMIIIGGIQYATSAGDPQKANKAKSTILYAVIGLIISLLAFAIVNFVLGSVFG